MSDNRTDEGTVHTAFNLGYSKPGSFAAGSVVMSVIAMVLAVAALLGPAIVPSSSSGGERLAVHLPEWVDILTVASLFAASLLLLALVAPRARRRKRDDDPERVEYREPPKLTAGAVAAFLAVVLLTAVLAAASLWLLSAKGRHTGLEFWSGLSTGASPTERAPESSASPDRPLDSLPLFSSVVMALALIVGLGSLGFMLWLHFGHWLELLWLVRLPMDAPARLVGAVEGGLEDLRLDPDARAAIIKCYRHFEEALAGVKWPRRPWETPLEFMRSALRQLPLPPRAVAHLTQLFELARFSNHSVGETERNAAWQSLLEIRETLSGLEKNASEPKR